MSGPKPVDFTGRTFGRLTVLREGQRVGHQRKLMCSCTCGVTKEMFLVVIKAGAQSCGCLQRELATTHGQSQDNPLYRTWANMKSRCSDPNAKYFPEYGGRGIRVCDEWATSFESFQDWATNSGYVAGLTLDREENSLGYSPKNCRWVNRTAQQRNRRSQRGSSSQYIGVSFIQRSQRWMAGIKIAGKAINLGVYTTELEAAKARDQYILENNLKDFTMNGVLP
jgi:hypothetical protein